VATINPPRLSDDRGVFFTTKEYTKPNPVLAMSNAFTSKFAMNVNPRDILDGLKKIAHTEKGVLTAIIHDKLVQVKTVVTEKQAQETYNRDVLLKFAPSSMKDDSTPTLDLLENYFSTRLESRIEDFKKIEKCAQLEIGMKYKMDGLLGNMVSPSLKCTSFYQKDQVNIAVTKLAQLYGYNVIVGDEGLLHLEV
jgi:hypothetical protein